MVRLSKQNHLLRLLPILLVLVHNLISDWLPHRQLLWFTDKSGQIPELQIRHRIISDSSMYTHSTLFHFTFDFWLARNQTGVSKWLGVLHWYLELHRHDVSVLQSPVSNYVHYMHRQAGRVLQLRFNAYHRCLCLFLHVD